MTAARLTDPVAAELIKLRTLPALWIALAVAVTANTALGAIAATDVIRLAGDGGPTGIEGAGALMLAPVYAYLAIAVFAAGTEYRNGQLRLSLAAVPGRARFLAAKLLAILVVSLLAAVPVLIPNLVLRGDLGDLGRYLAAYLLLALTGYGFAFAARTVVTPIAVLAAVPILVSTTLGGLWPTVVRVLPHEAALSLVGMPADPATALSPAAGLLVLTGWATVSVTIGGVLVARRDV
ncbi:hypothetical protein [Actinoplanes couchii]|uniref:ABC transporter permease n=1 Tax=Actinoplanes couchii TaxID=403638 RepID=A0ABQ3XCZ1_9ACTN|nr:hypothetical protein [Actinoplanes couchii]MDR6321268.1 ABC-2 type transport system permease protein [Actinoplanes couchii]GID56379.1 hypothetical protein Aco03nite_047830 [Actinoplanes couchii]